MASVNSTNPVGQPVTEVNLAITMNQSSKTFLGKLFTSFTAVIIGLTGAFVSGVPASGSTLQVELVGDLNVGAGDGFASSSSNKTVS